MGSFSVLTLFSGRHLMHVRRALALTLAVPVLLAGCSDETEPEPKMPETTSSSPTPTPTESETPEAESPEDFIRRWVKAGDEMQATGKVQAFRALSKGCQACADLIRTVQEVYGAGGSIEFGGSKITLLRRVGKEPPTFELNMQTPQTIVRNAQDDVQDEYPAGTGKYVVTLAGRGDSWRVAHYARR